MNDDSYKGHRERLRQRFSTEGLDGFPDHNVLELLLCYAIPRQDVNHLAHRLISRFGSLSGVLDADRDSLLQVPGVGNHTAALLRLIPAIGRRYLIDRAKAGKQRLCLRETDDAGAFFLPYFFGLQEEKVYAAFLDASFRLLSCRELSEGGISFAPVSLRRLVELALEQRAVNLILAHNHPGGQAIPSVEDRESTQSIALALKLVQLRLLDHIIVAENEFLSMEECGYLKNI